MKIIINCNKFYVAVSGHVGPPLPCCHIKLIDVPEMEYFAVNGQGEVFFFFNDIRFEYFSNWLTYGSTICCANTEIFPW